MQTKDLSISSHNLYNSDSRVNLYLPEIPKLEKSINGIINLKTPQVKFDPSDEHERVETRLRKQKNSELQLPETITSHDIHHYAISYILVIAAICVTIVWIARKRGWFNRKSTSVPTTTNATEREAFELQSRDTQSPIYASVEKLHNPLRRWTSMVERPRQAPAPLARERRPPPAPQVPQRVKDVQFNFD